VRRVVPGVALEARLARELLEVFGNVLRHGHGRGELGRVPAAAGVEAIKAEVGEVPGDHERGGRLLARFERERTSQRTGQLLAVRSARLVDAGPGIDREDARRHRVVGEGRDRPHGVATVEHRQGHRPIIVPVLQLEGGAWRACR
jgi:hypothetical protein